jgi:hypothetical protein
MLSVVILSVAMLSVAMLSVVMLNVVAPHMMLHSNIVALLALAWEGSVHLTFS